LLEKAIKILHVTNMIPE